MSAPPLPYDIDLHVDLGGEVPVERWELRRDGELLAVCWSRAHAEALAALRWELLDGLH